MHSDRYHRVSSSYSHTGRAPCPDSLKIDIPFCHELPLTKSMLRGHLPTGEGDSHRRSAKAPYDRSMKCPIHGGPRRPIHGSSDRPMNGVLPRAKMARLAPPARGLQRACPTPRGQNVYVSRSKRIRFVPIWFYVVCMAVIRWRVEGGLVGLGVVGTRCLPSIDSDADQAHKNDTGGRARIALPPVRFSEEASSLVKGRHSS